MVVLTLYVEGGGDSKLMRTACRQGFRLFLERAGLAGQMPRIVACGRRQATYEDFCTALASGRPAMLLVDSEAAVTARPPWTHLGERTGDAWERPEGAGDDDCHLMVQCMEHWFLTDPATLRAYSDRASGHGRCRAGQTPLN